ncbi:putative amidase (plasmid) [Sinorhizobium fredii HH103]|uniref:Amidase n=1 Tax=Sinorhizobium fredii (strain HH103) TaxID=1117943 RepID=G9AIT8_SINF1|nr:amidase [Sinorhizobium fredii]CCF00970.1 putative amidase [Sinorhizobium fredii HH103]
MTVRRPTLGQLKSVADSLSFDLSDEDLSFYLEEMQGALDLYDVVDALPDHLPKVKYPRTPGYRPGVDEDPLNAWYVKTEIKGATRGKLAGKTVAIKDNVAVAGVQMMNGASTLEGYMPDVDATVVARLLDAGATILGKAQCEYFCLSGGSHTGAQGPVRNPHNTNHSAAGSSSGSAALVANGEVDMAIGGDQGGSIRTPASYCGIVGLKPTWGLVPYTGAMPIELTIDHLGPMTRTVADNALMLEVIAGPDGLDPRQTALVKAQRYTRALGQSCAGLKIGVLKEGFGHPNSEPDVDQSVRDAANRFRDLGAEVEEVSVPMHHAGPAIWLVVAFEGATEQLMKGNGHGFNWKGLYVTSMIDAHSAWRQRADELPDSVKQTMLTGEWMIRTGRGRYYAKAQNLTRKLRAHYDAALASYDIILMPTTPMKAPPLPGRDSPRSLALRRATENMANTFPFDLTSHPAISIPCGFSDRLPVGMMLVGRHFDEMTLYRAAHAFEQSAGVRCD